MTTFKSFWTKYLSEVHHHHEVEEEIFFPYMEKVVKMPPKLTSDHLELFVLMEDLDKQIKALGTSSKDNAIQSLVDVVVDFTAFKRKMNAHLAEEEEVGLPMLRFHFSEKTIKPAIDKLLAKIKPENTAW